MNTLKYQLLLGSQSPRRKEILEKAGFAFNQVAIEVEETYPDTLGAEHVPEFLARKKSEAYGSLKKGQLLLTSDTVVILEGDILGKPASEEDACQMLRSLSGKEHTVVTGVCLRSEGKLESFSDRTEVGVSKVSDETIKWYVQTFKPFDKAGSYGVQEWFGIVAVSYIRGSYYNVMGLPMHRVSAALNQF